MKRAFILPIRVTDAVDPSPVLTEAKLTGGPSNVNYQLPRQLNPDGTFRMGLPALTPGDNIPYRLRFTAIDATGNKTTLQRTFYFNPPIISTEWGSSFNVISTEIPVYSETGSSTALRSLVLKDAHDIPISGVYEITAFNAVTSSTPVEINGVTLQPGDSTVVDSAYDLGAAGSRINLPMRPLLKNKNADILLFTNSGSAPGVFFTVSSNQPSTKLSLSSNTARQLDLVVANASNTNSVCSAVYASPENLDSFSSKNPMVSPACFYEWTTPFEFSSTDSISGEHASRPETIGVMPIKTTFFTLINGQREELGAIEKQVEVSQLVVTTEVGNAVSNTSLARIEPFTFALKEPSDCSFTDNQNSIKTSSRPLCLLEFTHLPVGFEEPYQRRMQSRRGTFTQAGEYYFEWRLGTIGQSGSIIWSEPSRHDVTVFDPEPPVLIFSKGQWLPTGEVAVSYADPIPLMLGRNTHKTANVDVTVYSDKLAEPRVFENVKPGQYIPIPGFETAMWDLGTYDVVTRFSKYQEIYSEDSFVARMMPSVRVNTSLNGERSHINNTDYVLKYNMFGNLQGDIQFDPLKMGEWDVHIAYFTAGKYHSITQPQQMRPDGIEFTITAEQLQTLASNEHRYFAIANLRSPTPELGRQVISRGIAPRIYNGTPIDGFIDATATEGPAPLVTRLSLRAEKEETSAIGSLQWQTSTDGGATWADVEKGERSTISLSLAPADHLFRVKMINRYSNVESYTEEFPVWAYEHLEVRITGNEHTMPNVPATITAQAYVGDTLIEDAEYEWTYRGEDGQVVTKTGPILTYSQSKDGTQYFTARARRTNADEGMRQSWSSERARLVIESPKAPLVSLRGPTIVEAGYTYDFSATTLTTWRDKSSTLTFSQQWLLPDGSYIDGDKLTFTPSQELLDEVGFGEYFSIKHQSWVDGYKETSLRESVRKVRIWKYEWPEFITTSRQRYDSAPTDITVEVKPSDVTWYRRTFGEPITYDWDLPEGIEIRSVISNRVVLRATQAGTFPVTVTVSDTRGHQSVSNIDLNVLPTPPYDVRVDLGASNKYWRAPLTVNARLSTSGGHRENKISTITWSLNGEEIPGVTGARPRIDIPSSGEYELTAHVNTVLDVPTDTISPFTANNNTPPICEIIHASSKSTLMLDASCSDPDGRIAKHTWIIDGQEAATTARRVSLNTDGKLSVNVTLIATDDSGEQTTITTTILL